MFLHKLITFFSIFVGIFFSFFLSCISTFSPMLSSHSWSQELFGKKIVHQTKLTNKLTNFFSLYHSTSFTSFLLSNYLMASNIIFAWINSFSMFSACIGIISKFLDNYNLFSFSLWLSLILQSQCNCYFTLEDFFPSLFES